MNLESPRGFARATENATPKAGDLQAPLRTRYTPGVRRAVSASPAMTATPGAACVTDADIQDLSVRNLVIPVNGVESRQLHDSFFDARSEGRIHKALDIMAPRDTPVVATDDGIVMKLHQSDRGGVMLYQSDPSRRYVYYYGHLNRYADGISEGKAIRRGEVIAYVGDTGNAGPGNCHLHFGISKVTEPGRWSGGDAINPYPLLTGQPQSIEAGK